MVVEVKHTNIVSTICLRSKGWQSVICLNCSMMLESLSETESASI